MKRSPGSNRSPQRHRKVANLGGVHDILVLLGAFVDRRPIRSYVSLVSVADKEGAMRMIFSKMSRTTAPRYIQRDDPALPTLYGVQYSKSRLSILALVNRFARPYHIGCVIYLASLTPHHSVRWQLLTRRLGYPKRRLILVREYCNMK